jgi:protease-4
MSIRRLALCLACLSLAACSSGSRTRTPRVPSVAELHELVLEGAAPEEPSNELLSGGGAHHTQRELLEELENVVKQPLIKGVYLRLSGLGGAWARAAELRAALARVREAHKPVHCHFDMLDNAGYSVLASSCDRISMGPTGLLMLTGIQAETVYAKDLLELVGLRAELLQVGRFKGAADALTRSSMPDDVREVLNALVDDLQANLNSAVTTGRKLETTAVQSAVDSGPHAADSALALKLIDAVTFDDEARARAKEASKAERVVQPLRDDQREQLEVGQLLKLVLGGKPEKTTGKRVLLAYLTGTISDDNREQGGGAASGPFVTAMRRAADDEDVKALVLRINSPGGSALASDKMWHALARVSKRKPVIVSVGDMAASGGYYVASAAHEIFAEDESLVGSIGVVGGKVVGEQLAARLGIRPMALRRGQNAGWTSPFHAFSDTERSAVQRAMQQTYDTFLTRVRAGRKLEGTNLSQVAEGRIMSGKRARAGGLVDKVGGLDDALAQARSKAGLPADAKLELWPNERSMLERASRLLSGAQSLTPVQQLMAAVPTVAESPVVQSLVQGDATPLAALPYALRLE